MKSLADTLAAIEAEIARQMASGNPSALVAGMIAHRAVEVALDREAIDLEPTEYDLIDEEARLRSMPGYYDGF